MAKAAICFATADAAFAGKLSSYLDFHTSVVFELAECESSEYFLDVVEQCLAYEVVIVILSNASVPKLWARADWERVLIRCVRESGSHLSYLSREACSYPQVLKRSAFFDSRMALRQWIIQTLHPERHPPSFTQGREDASLLDLLHRPGLVSNAKRSAADWFVSNQWRCFENVYRVECGNWTRASVLGEVSQAMNLRLSGPVDQNWQALQNHAQVERALHVFEYLTEEFSELAQLGGKSSVIVLANDRVPEQVTLERLKEMFFAPRPEEAACLRLLNRFMNGEQDPGHWADVKSIGFRARLFFQKELRLAEAHELLVWLAIQAQRNRDKRALEQIQWEENWILDSWNLPPVERTENMRTPPTQLSLYPSSI